MYVQSDPETLSAPADTGTIFPHDIGPDVSWASLRACGLHSLGGGFDGDVG